MVAKLPGSGSRSAEMSECIQGKVMTNPLISDQVTRGPSRDAVAYYRLKCLGDHTIRSANTEVVDVGSYREVELQHGVMDTSDPDPHESTGLELKIGGIVDDLFKAHLVATQGTRYTVERLSVVLETYARCPLRNECWAMQALEQKNNAIIPISPDYEVYPLVPPQGRQAEGIALVGPEVITFNIQLVYEPYTLFVMRVEAEARNLDTRLTTKLVSKHFATLSTENGNSGGCHDIEQWRKSANYLAPTKRTFGAGLSRSAYSLLTYRAVHDEGLPTTLLPTEANTLYTEVSEEIVKAKLPYNWLPILTRLELEAEGESAFYPDRTIAVANQLRWLPPTTGSLYGWFVPELRRVAAFRDIIDSIVAKATPEQRKMAQPLWQRAKFVEMDESSNSRCKGGDGLFGGLDSHSKRYIQQLSD